MALYVHAWSALLGYASLFVAITVLSYVQLVSCGFLDEYIGRSYMETKQRPIYLIRKTYGDYSRQGYGTTTLS